MLDVLDGYPVYGKHIVKGIYLKVNIINMLYAVVGNGCIFNGNRKVVAQAQTDDLEHFRVFLHMEKIRVFEFCFSCQGSQDFGGRLETGFLQ